LLSFLKLPDLEYILSSFDFLFYSFPQMLNQRRQQKQVTEDYIEIITIFETRQLFPLKKKKKKRKI